MQGRYSILTCRAAGRVRSPQPQARRPQSRYQLLVVKDKTKPTIHSHTQGALPIGRADTPDPPGGPRAEPGPPGRRPGGPSRGTSRSSPRTRRGLLTTPTRRAHCRYAGQTLRTRLQGRGPSPDPPAAGPAAPVEVPAARRDGQDEAY